jgi:hypothetical protein
MRKTFIVISIAANLVLLAGLIMAWTAIRNARHNLSQSEAGLKELNRSWQSHLDALDADRLKLNEQVSIMAVELAAARAAMEKTQRQLSAGSSAHSAISKDAAEPVSGAQLKLNRAKEIGRHLAAIGKLSKDPKKINGPEMFRRGTEMMTMFSELGMDPMGFRGGDAWGVLYDPITRQLIANIMVGVFEEFGQPLSPDQTARYEGMLARFAEFDQSITKDCRNSMEKSIARLANYDTVSSMMADLSLVFSDEQRAAIDQTVIRELVRPNPFNVSSVSNEQIKDRAQASRFVLDSWTGQFDKDSPPEMRESLRPIAEQYVKDYTVLKNNLVSTNDPVLMDYYLQRNKPVERNKMGAYYQEREKFFASSPANARVKASLDIEFLKIRNSYQQKVARAAGTDTLDSWSNNIPVVFHFPNLE